MENPGRGEGGEARREQGQSQVPGSALGNPRQDFDVPEAQQVYASLSTQLNLGSR